MPTITPIDPDRIGIMGDSDGGHLAAVAALTDDHPDLEGDSGWSGYSSQVQAAATISANSDFLALDNLDTHLPPPAVPVRLCRDLHGVEQALTQLFGGPLADRQDLMRVASPITDVSRGAPPLLIVHGTLDDTVPFDQAERLHHALQAVGADTTFTPVEGGHHNLRHDPDLTWGGEVWDRVAEQTIDFFNRQLSKSPET